jgi:excisionase family DNA binding protein
MSKPTQSKAGPELFTVAEAAARLKVTDQTIYNWISKGELAVYPHVTGIAKLVTAESVRAFIERKQFKEEK